MSGIVTFTPSPAVDLSTSVGRLAPTEKLRCGAVRRDPGGGGINVARALTRFGVQTLAVYPAGGPVGAQLGALLEAEATPQRPVASRNETRENFYVLETDTGRQFKFILPGPELEPEALEACLTALDLEHSRPAYVVCSGGLPPGAAEDLYVRVARAAKAAGVPVVVDSHGPGFAAALREGVDLIKPSLGELRELLGHPLEDEAAWLDACRSLARSGQARTVALSLGEQGAMLVTGQEAWRASAPPVEVLSSVGAGDSFLAGLLAAFVSRTSPPDALRQAVAAGAAALLGPGTELCRPADVARVAREVRIQRLAPA